MENNDAGFFIYNDDNVAELVDALFNKRTLTYNW